MPASRSCARNARACAITIAFGLGLGGHAYASPGCTAVNGGAFNLSGSGFATPAATVSGFDVGDIVTITRSGGGGTFALTTGSGSPLGSDSLSSVPSVSSYTIQGASDDTTLIINIYKSTNYLVSATCIPIDPGGSAADRSESATRGFLQSRMNGLLLSDPGGYKLHNRGTSGGPMEVASAGNTSTNVASNSAAAFGSAMGLGSGLASLDETAPTLQNIRFRQSLSQMRHQARAAQAGQDRMALGAGNGGALPIMYEAYSPWDVWVEGTYSGFNDAAGRLDRDGHVGVLYLGGDYRITPDMILGGLAQFDWAKDDSGAIDSSVDGHGWMIGPYFSARVHENIYLDLRAAWGRSMNDIDVAGATGSFDTTRWLVRGELAGNWLYDAWRITPSADLAYVKESSDSYTNSAGTFVPGQSVSLGRLQFGPEVGYRIVHTSDSFIEPFGAIRGVWDFDNPNVAIIDGFVVGPGDFWGRLEGGLNWVTTSGLFVRGSATWDGMGAGDYNGYTLQGTVNVPLN